MIKKEEILFRTNIPIKFNNFNESIKIKNIIFAYPNEKNVISSITDYSTNIVCSVEKENIFGTQFHPEKSDKLGLQFIENFISI